MSVYKVWVHFIWATKNRKPLLTKTLRSALFLHMKQNSNEKNFHIDFVNGYVDHVHCLVRIGPNYSVSKIANLIKGESSHWINANKLCDEHFEWQSDYYAVSVSLSVLENVRKYIENQELHHMNGSINDGYEFHALPRP